jgi:RNA polymerase sigma-B factor
LRRYLRDQSTSIRVPRRVYELAPTIWQAVDTLTQREGRSPGADEVATETGLPIDDVIEVIVAHERRAPQSIDASGPAGLTIAESIGIDDDRLAGVLDHDALATALAVLDDGDRTLLSLYFVSGLTQREIGDVLGVSQMQVSRLLAGTVRRVRSHMPAT